MKTTLQLITDGENPGDIYKEWLWEGAVPNMEGVDLIEYEGRPFVYFDSADVGSDGEIWIYCLAEKSLMFDETGAHMTQEWLAR